MEPECSLLCSPNPANASYLEPLESSLNPQTLVL